MSNYKCKNAVIMFVFNRPDNAMKVFEQVRKVKPPRLYFVCDGIRDNNDIEKVEECKKIIENVDWNCDVTKIFSKTNLGCKKRIITGITSAFETEEKLIILEDDCVPTEEFFEFVDKCLEMYENNEEVAIVSGSNLLDYKYNEINKNGFSMYINCWGWATWKRTWNVYDSFLSIQEINKSFKSFMSNKPLSFFQKKYWKCIFKHSVYTRTIWDFYLQYFFFKYNFCSVYPAVNLIHNIGFSEDSTHMKNEPDYIIKSLPTKEKIREMKTKSFVDFSENLINKSRDKDVLKILYGYSIISFFKILVGNLLRYIGIIK